MDGRSTRVRAEIQRAHRQSQTLCRSRVLHLQCLSAVTGEHQFDTILTRRKAVRQREAVVAAHRCRVQMRRNGEGDGWMCRLANHEPAFGFRGFQDDVARAVFGKLVPEGLDVTRDRRTEFVDESPTVNADEISFLAAASSSRTRTASRFRSSSTSRLIQSATTSPVLMSTPFVALARRRPEPFDIPHLTVRLAPPIGGRVYPSLAVVIRDDRQNGQAVGGAGASRRES